MRRFIDATDLCTNLMIFEKGYIDRMEQEHIEPNAYTDSVLELTSLFYDMINDAKDFDLDNLLDELKQKKAALAFLDEEISFNNGLSVAIETIKESVENGID